MTTINGVGNAAIDNQLLYQGILEEPLAAQTISGAIKGQFSCLSTNLGVGFLAVRACIVSLDGSSVQELLGVTSSTNTGAQPPGFAVSATNRRLEQGNDDFSLDLTPTEITGGYLMYEVGYADPSANTGRFASIIVGDDSGSDLPEDETTTTANNPWIELSTDPVFDTGGVTVPRFMQNYRRRRV